jgi:cytochrome c oxidase cbb3-type subunit 3
MAQAQKDIDAYLKSQAMNVDETNVTKLDDATALAEGKNIFVTNCAVCHKENASGDIGPNLTDKFWIYGNDIKDVFKTVKNGTPNGMPDHASKLNPIQLQQVSSFILSLKPVAGKEPQGKEVK